jgi:conjugative transfer pilus assembly protein TraH
MKIIKIVVMVLFINILPIQLQYGYAGIGNSMDSFWKRMGGMSTSTGAGSYRSQAAGYWTGGSYYAKTNTKTVSPFNFQMPSLEIGSCSKIHLFKGSLSMIDMQHMQELLQAIASNAMTFAFQLAMETVSPVIAEKIEEIQGWLQKMNSLNIGSCENAQMLVGAMWPKHERASKLICEKTGHTSGGLSDYTASKHGCGDAEQRNEIEKNSEGKNKAPIEDLNITWNAIKNKKFFKESEEQDEKAGLSDDDLRSLFMTLSGTIIIHAPKNDTDEPKYIYKSARADYGNVVKALMDGGKIEVISCGTDKDKCLNPTYKTVTILEENAFRRQTEKILKSIIEKIKKDERVTGTEDGMLEMIEESQIPIHKVLTVHAAYSGSGELFELSAYADSIALQVLYAFLDDALRKVSEAIDEQLVSTEDQLHKMRTNIAAARQSIYQREMKTHQNYNVILGMVKNTMFIEKLIAQEQGANMSDLLTKLGEN